MNGKIFVAGHRGLVGSALVRAFQAKNSNIVVRAHSELDLADSFAVNDFFQSERPTVVCLAAAKVGGILANRDFPAEFIRDNIAIQLNVLNAAWRFGVERLLFLGSSCIYPRDCAQPIREEYLLSGPLESTNQAYAIAKISGIEMCRAYNKQYGTHFIAVMPTNLFGAGDSYDSKNSHVLPALIRKFHEGKISASPSVEVWGTGKPRREFLCSDDLAAACLLLLDLPDGRFDAIAMTEPPLLNIGAGRDISISDLANLVREVVGYQGEIIWNTSMPDGTPRKLLDISKLKELGWEAAIPLRQGIAHAYADFCSRLA